MKRLLALVIFVCILSTVRAEEPARIDWRTDLAAARAEARDTRRPLFLVFRCEA